MFAENFVYKAVNFQISLNEKKNKNLDLEYSNESAVTRIKRYGEHKLTFTPKRWWRGSRPVVHEAKKWATESRFGTLLIKHVKRSSLCIPQREKGVNNVYMYVK